MTVWNIELLLEKNSCSMRWWSGNVAQEGAAVSSEPVHEPGKASHVLWASVYLFLKKEIGTGMWWTLTLCYDLDICG